MLHSVKVFLLSSFVFCTLIERGKTCNPGFYGPNCTLRCSPGCRYGNCKLQTDGSAPCIEGCEPGWYGSQCKIPCQVPGDKCQKCPSECEAGFCQLGSRCVSGCVDSYYGTSCFTCGSDCQVCNKHTGRCYNCTDGCPSSYCVVQECQTTVQGVGTTGRTQSIHWTVWVGVGLMLLLVLIVCALFLIYRRRQNAPAVPVRSHRKEKNPGASTQIHRNMSLDIQRGRPSTRRDLHTIVKIGLSADREIHSTENEHGSGQDLEDIYEISDNTGSVGSSFNDVYENV